MLAKSTSLYLWLTLGVLFLTGCSSAPAPVEEPTATQAAPTPLPTEQREQASTAADASEVTAALHRVFGSTVLPVQQNRWYAIGDFNGDGSTDVVALVRPSARQLPELNSQFANWTIQDAAHAFFPPANQRVITMPPKPPAQRVKANELLLAVIHGEGAKGWRDPQARQAYLVRNANAGPMQVVPAAGHTLGASVSLRNASVIYEMRSPPGFLFWTGSQYAWHQTNVPGRD
jgi:hypothetical protein